MILVTGGTGFLGRNMLPILCEAGFQVRVITRTPQAYPWLAGLPVEVIQADVADPAVVRRAVQGVRYIIHAAGLFRFFAKADEFDHTNVDGTRNILEAAASAGVEKVVHVSTIVVAGYPRDPNQIIDENYPPDPTDDYQRTKMAGEQLVLQYFRERGVPSVILRGGAFYGPYGRYAFNQLFFEDPLINHLPMGVDSGKHITFPVYIKDMARACLLGLEKGRAGEIYNICSQSLPHRAVEHTIAQLSGTSDFRIYAPGGIMVQFAKILTWLSRVSGREQKYVITMRPYIFGEWNVSIEKARRELGFVPTPLEDGVRETLQWYAEAGLWKPKKKL